MIGIKGGKRTSEVQNYKEVPQSTKKYEEVQKTAFPLRWNILVDQR